MTRSTPRPPWLAAEARPDSDPFLRRHETTLLAEDQTHAAPGCDPGEKRAADVRRRAIDRLVMMNTYQVEDSWGRRRRDPVEPHGIALLFVQPDPRGLPPYRHRLTAATKRWLQDDHCFDVHQRVFRFYRDLAAELTEPGIDIRMHADRRDEDMAEDAVYVGLAVSSLDTSTGQWTDVVATASVATTDIRPVRLWGRTDTFASRPAPAPVQMPVEDHRDIPGSIRIVLTDGTFIVGERRGRPDFDHKIIQSTHTLDFGPSDCPYPWGWVSREELDADPDHSEVIRWMSHLNDLCWQTDAARRDALRNRPRSRRARS